LVVGERPGFVQNFGRHFDLADVVQQRAEAEYLQRVAIEPEVAAEGEREDAHAQTVHGRVLVLFLQLNEAGERVGIANDAFGELADNALRPDRVDVLAGAHVLEELIHERARDRVMFARLAELLFERALVAVDRRRARLVDDLQEVARDALLRFCRHRRYSADRSRRLCAPFGRADLRIGNIDVNPAAIALELIDVGLRADLETLEQERRPEPWPIELGHVHAHFQVLDVYLLAHESTPRLRAPSDPWGARVP